MSEAAHNDIHTDAIRALRGRGFTRRRELAVGSVSFRIGGPAAADAADALGDRAVALANLDGLTGAIYGVGLPRADRPGVFDLSLTGALLVEYARLLSARGLGRAVGLPVCALADEPFRIPRHRVSLMMSLWTPGAQVARADLVEVPGG